VCWVFYCSTVPNEGNAKPMQGLAMASIALYGQRADVQVQVPLGTKPTPDNIGAAFPLSLEWWMRSNGIRGGLNTLRFRCFACTLDGMEVEPCLSCHFALFERHRRAFAEIL
jgi:hypothetical protein